MKYHFRVHRESQGYWAECLELDGCQTQADTRKELTANMREALDLFLDEAPSSTRAHPLPRKPPKGRAVVEVPVSAHIAFATQLRALRHSRALTQAEAAALLGFKNLYSYQRLESSKSANPQLSMLARIKNVFPEFHLDELVAA